MNGYVCFYKSLRMEVHADSSFAAQKLAAEKLKVKEKQRHLIAVVLADKPIDPAVLP